MAKQLVEKGYRVLLSEIKRKIQEARNHAYLAVNREMILLYWEIGRSIAEKQEQEGWGSKVIDRLAQDLSVESEENHSFSARNLKYMLKFYRAYPKILFVQRLVAQIPWGQNISIIEKIKTQKQREFYLKACLENAWTRPVLVHQIESGLYERAVAVNKQHNFRETLPEELAEQAESALKDSYNLEFLGLDRKVKEREIESRMMAEIRDVLLELGQGFAFLGSQYKLQLEEDEYFIDLLFVRSVYIRMLSNNTRCRAAPKAA